MSNMCFACGNDNPISLRLNFKEIAEKKVEAVFIPRPVHQGYEDVVHGGIVSTLLDEAMVTAIAKQKIEAVTAELNVRFKENIKIGEELYVRGCITGKKSRLILTEGEIKNSSGQLKAKAKAKFMIVV